MLADPAAFWASLSGAVVSACVGVLAYRQGQRHAIDEELDELEERLRKVENGLTEAQTIIRLRRERERRERRRQ